MKQRVASVFRGALDAFHPGAEFLPASRVPGGELVYLGGGELVPTPGVTSLPLDDEYRANGLGGGSLALPPARVRVLEGVHIVVGENAVRLPDGTVVGESASGTSLRSLPRRHRASSAVDRSGRAAPYGAAGGDALAGLVESLPRALLLQHPALTHLAPVTVLCAPGAPPLEAWLRDRIDSRRVVVETCTDGEVVAPATTVLPSPVSRAGAGAIPRWYRRWVDVQSDGAGASPGRRRLLLSHGGADVALSGIPVLRDAAARFGLTALDTSSGDILDLDDGTPTGEVWSAMEIVAALRDAAVVVGASDAALGHALACRRADVVQVGVGPTCTPRVAQLAESRGLPHRFVRPEGLPAALDVVLGDG